MIKSTDKVKDIGFVRFYCISTIVGYLLPNSLYTFNYKLPHLINNFKSARAHFLRTVSGIIM